MGWPSGCACSSVTKTLGRTVASLKDDAEALNVVANTARLHAALLTKRAALTGRKAIMEAGLDQVPFGTQPLGDGVERFRVDLVSCPNYELCRVYVR